MKKVSVIIPVYNVEKYLRACLDSVVNQTLKDIEIICVDDGSTDSSSAILAEYAAKDSRLSDMTQANAGAAVARNAGLAVATGEYLYFCDPDDFAESNMLADLFGRATETASDIVLAGRNKWDESIGRVVATKTFPRRVLELPKTFTPHEIAPFLFTSFGWAPWDKLIRRAFVLENKLAFQKIARDNDVSFSILALAFARRLSVINRAYYNYRVGQANTLQSGCDRTPCTAVDALRAIHARLSSAGLLETYRAAFANLVVKVVLVKVQAFSSAAALRCFYENVRAGIREGLFPERLDLKYTNRDAAAVY